MLVDEIVDELLLHPDELLYCEKMVLAMVLVDNRGGGGGGARTEASDWTYPFVVVADRQLTRGLENLLRVREQVLDYVEDQCLTAFNDAAEYEEESLFARSRAPVSQLIHCNR